MPPCGPLKLNRLLEQASPNDPNCSPSFLFSAFRFSPPTVSIHQLMLQSVAGEFHVGRQE